MGRPKTQITKGDKFNKLSFVGEAAPYVSPYGQTKFRGKFLCDCGTKITTVVSAVVSGKIKSCDCRHVRHGLSKNRPLYQRWLDMHARYNDKHAHYNRYGGRGIKVAKIWHDAKGLARFVEWAKANGFHPTLELDREENDKGYSPGNCRFVTKKKNVNNRSSTRMVTIPKSGKIVSFKELYDRRPRPVTYTSACKRYFDLGWSLKDALSKLK